MIVHQIPIHSYIKKNRGFNTITVPAFTGGNKVSSITKYLAKVPAIP